MLDFIEQYYILFIVISVILIFSLIGYFVNERNKKVLVLKLIMKHMIN